MSVSIIISFIVITIVYYFVSRFIGSFILNLCGITVDNEEGSGFHIVIWIPFIGELMALIYLGMYIPILTSRYTAKFATAARARLGLKKLNPWD